MAKFRARILAGIIVLSVLCLYSQFLEIRSLKENKNSVAEEVGNVTAAARLQYVKDLLFQPNEAVEFPTVKNSTPKIPHIIHQICHSDMILDIFTDPMQSFARNNPTWVYRFWTYDSGRQFLDTHYPYLVEKYDAFGTTVKKSDLLRMAVMHEYGGVYADLDVKNLRPLDMATMKYSCIVPTEPFEHSAVGYRKEVILSTAVLLCRPKHPFFKQLLLNLQLADPGGHPVIVTGPMFVTQTYLSYNNITEEDLRKPKTDISSNSPFFYKGLLPDDHDNAVYIPNTQYFMDQVDISIIQSGGLNACLTNSNDVSELSKRACNEFESRKDLRERKKYAFTSHYWFHMWMQSESELDRYEKHHIREIIPRCVFYQK